MPDEVKSQNIVYKRRDSMNIRKGSVDLNGSDQSVKSATTKKLKRLNSKDSGEFDIEFIN